MVFYIEYFTLSSLKGQQGAKPPSALLLCDTANFGIDPTPSKYRVNIADIHTDTSTSILESYVGERRLS